MQDQRGQYLTLKEFADKTGIPIRTLYDFCKKGMPHEERGSLYFVYEDQAKAWIDANVEPKTVYTVKTS